MLGSFCTIYTLYDFLKAINYLKKVELIGMRFFIRSAGSLSA